MRIVTAILTAALSAAALLATPALAADAKAGALVDQAISLVETDPVAARAIMEKAAQTGDPDGLANLGVFMATGVGGPVDTVSAIKLYERAVAGGSKVGALNLGRVLLRDDDAENDARGIDLLSPLVEDDKLYGAVLYPLGRAMLFGQGGRKAMIPEGLKLLQEAEPFEPDNEDLLFLLARGHQNGWGDWEPDQVKAAGYFRRSAEAGDHRSEWYYGMMLLNGEGVAMDARQAWNWVRKSAEGGYLNGQVSTAVMLAVGQGVQENDAEARQWYRKAAERGSAHALRGLGYMMVTGEGGAADIPAGVAYLELSRDGGMDSAGALLDSLNLRLDEAERRKADAIKADWIGRFGKPE